MSFNREQAEQTYRISLLWNTLADIKRMPLISMCTSKISRYIK